MRAAFVIVLLTPMISHAGYFVEESLYSPVALAVGKGKTVAAAERDSRSAIPTARYEPDRAQNSPAYQCLGSPVAWSAEKECEGKEIQFTIPLRPIKL